MKIERIENISFDQTAAVDAAFATITPQAIACNNWAAEFPYAPKVAFRMFHTGKLLFLRFDVEEHYTLAHVTQDNGEVWTDSCAEFFIALDQSGYYNFETTCIGSMLLAFRKERPLPTYTTAQVMQSVLRRASLGNTPFDERVGDNRWSLTLAIPPQALFRHALTDWTGVKASMNLYKCGDNLSHPHFLSWRPIANPTPDFHLPQFFEHVEFL
ncbi:MAG: carbohydrate-binding family 9-like protein [Alistipes sp.]